MSSAASIDVQEIHLNPCVLVSNNKNQPTGLLIIIIIIIIWRYLVYVKASKYFDILKKKKGTNPELFPRLPFPFPWKLKFPYDSLDIFARNFAIYIILSPPFFFINLHSETSSRQPTDFTIPSLRIPIRAVPSVFARRSIVSRYSRVSRRLFSSGHVHYTFISNGARRSEWAARIGTRSNITERSGKKKGKMLGRIFLPIRRRALPPPPFPPDNCDTTRHDTEKPLFNHEVRGARNIFDDAKLHVTNWFPATAREHATGSRRRRRANKNDLTLFSRSKHGRRRRRRRRNDQSGICLL